jgi:hypothetical protein
LQHRQFFVDLGALSAYLNIKQAIIVTTEDKVRLCLLEHLSLMEQKSAWLTPLGIFLTILIIFPTTTFKNFLQLKAEVWQSFFIWIALFCAIWTVVSFMRARKSSTLDDVVKQIRQTSIPTTEIDQR